MIFDKIKNIGIYAGISAEFASAAALAEELNADAESGRHEGEKGVFCNVGTNSLKDSENAGFEAHRRYADIQYIVKGAERIDYLNISDVIDWTEYNPDSDIHFGKNPKFAPNTVILREGEFAVFFPEDAHAPGIRTESSSEAKKIVIKVPV